MLRVANLCAELSNRNNILIKFWQNASQALYHRNTEQPREKIMFNELLNKIKVNKLWELTMSFWTTDPHQERLWNS